MHPAAVCTLSAWIPQQCWWYFPGTPPSVCQDEIHLRTHYFNYVSHSGAGMPQRGRRYSGRSLCSEAKHLAVWIPKALTHRRQIHCSSGHGWVVNWHNRTPQRAREPFSQRHRHFRHFTCRSCASRCGMHENLKQTGLELSSLLIKGTSKLLLMWPLCGFSTALFAKK